MVIVHSSDLHLGVDDSFSDHDRLAALPKVLTAANKVGADVVVLAGDTFDNHRQPLELLEHAAQMLRDYRNPIVILPGNHDPLTPDSVYRRGGLATIPNISILGLNVEESVTFPAFELEIWGRPHIDYTDHGHYVDEPRDPHRLIGSWLIHSEDLVATGADYVALGHWNQATAVGDGRVIAHYSGSPEYVGTVNVVRMWGNGQVEVAQAPLNGFAK